MKQGIEIKPGEDILDLRIMIADGIGVVRGQVKAEVEPCQSAHEGPHQLATSSASPTAVRRLEKMGSRNFWISSGDL